MCGHMKMRAHRDLIIFAILVLFCMVRVRSRPQVPCLFIFGDSLVDNGNNNGLLTLSRANYSPYGIDFPSGITGRFTNGLTTVDILAKLLGFSDFIPPYASTQGRAILRGLNYASGASGIRDETGNNLGDHLSMDQQVENFRKTLQQMRGFFRGRTNRVNAYLSQCIFSVGMGSNDYLNNYFMPNLYTTSLEYSPSTYATLLLDDYSRQLTKLYDLGARKVAVSAVGRIGCIPYEIARLNGSDNSNRNGSRCNERINKAIYKFNKGLRKMLDRFNNGQLPGAKFVFVNTYHTSKIMIDHAASYGFKVIDKGCCGVGRNNGQITCLPLQEPCQDRSKYVFWDAFHPTEASNIILANKSYSSMSWSDVFPMNIRQLAMA
ncbi:GDSL esterase/lipase At1g33811-like [Magnolia sinica]|uniref:GDSL esterase/lipase At1g33811-like n=1 Tax=Magnolia sinica TaxID=86752 RepID=UPI00265A115A|nr:GDSL esterase/lipase At1g33811-like [Magnolia sinica]